MTSIDPSQFTRIMSLPQVERIDLLEFLGATPVPKAQIERLINQVTCDYKRMGQDEAKGQSTHCA